MRCVICFQKIFHKRGLNLALCSNCLRDIEPVLYSTTIIIRNNVAYKCSALFRYDRTIKKIISSFKFSRELKQARACAGLMLENLNLTFSPDIIVPVPSHPVEEIRRGFSHMNYLCDMISSRLEIPYYPVIGRKLFPIFSRNQKNKDKKQRINAGKRFYIRNGAPDIKNKRILLLDDVMTTGVTMNSCADILITNGAAKVHGISLALTPG